MTCSPGLEYLNQILFNRPQQFCIQAILISFIKQLLVFLHFNISACSHGPGGAKCEDSPGREAARPRAEGPGAPGPPPLGPQLVPLLAQLL